MAKSDLSSQERRDFIEKCGRFAVVTPPTVALMLAADGRNYAQAFSGGGQNDQGEDNNDQGEDEQ